MTLATYTDDTGRIEVEVTQSGDGFAYTLFIDGEEVDAKSFDSQEGLVEAIDSLDYDALLDAYDYDGGDTGETTRSIGDVDYDPVNDLSDAELAQLESQSRSYWDMVTQGDNPNQTEAFLDIVEAFNSDDTEADDSDEIETEEDWWDAYPAKLGEGNIVEYNNIDEDTWAGIDDGLEHGREYKITDLKAPDEAGQPAFEAEALSKTTGEPLSNSYTYAIMDELDGDFRLKSVGNSDEKLEEAYEEYDFSQLPDNWSVSMERAESTFGDDYNKVVFTRDGTDTKAEVFMHGGGKFAQRVYDAPKGWIDSPFSDTTTADIGAQKPTAEQAFDRITKWINENEDQSDTGSDSPKMGLSDSFRDEVLDDVTQLDGVGEATAKSFLNEWEDNLTKKGVYVDSYADALEKVRKAGVGVIGFGYLTYPKNVSRSAIGDVKDYIENRVKKAHGLPRYTPEGDFGNGFTALLDAGGTPKEGAEQYLLDRSMPYDEWLESGGRGFYDSSQSDDAPLGMYGGEDALKVFEKYVPDDWSVVTQTNSFKIVPEGQESDEFPDKKYTLTHKGGDEPWQASRNPRNKAGTFEGLGFYADGADGAMAIVEDARWDDQPNEDDDRRDEISTAEPIERHFHSVEPPTRRNDLKTTLVSKINGVGYDQMYREFEVETLHQALEAYEHGALTPEKWDDALNYNSSVTNSLFQVLEFYDQTLNHGVAPSDVDLPDFSTETEPEPEPDYDSDKERHKAVYGEEFVRSRSYDEDGNLIDWKDTLENSEKLENTPYRSESTEDYLARHVPDYEQGDRLVATDWINMDVDEERPFEIAFSLGVESRASPISRSDITTRVVPLSKRSHEPMAGYEADPTRDKRPIQVSLPQLVEDAKPLVEDEPDDSTGGQTPTVDTDKTSAKEQLADIKGIGEKTAKQLVDAGITDKLELMDSLGDGGTASEIIPNFHHTTVQEQL